MPFTKLNKRMPVILNELWANGFVVLRDLVSEDEITKINKELEPWFDRTPRCQGDFYGWTTTRFGAGLTKAPSCQKLATNPIIAAIMDTVLGPNCDWYQLNLSQAVRIHPGAPRQPAHRDEDMWPGPKSFEYLVNVIWALDDFTEQNGSTLIWPRSRTSPRVGIVDEDRATVARMKKGSAVVFLGSTLHCGGANTSQSDRTGLILSYCLGWLKQYENQFLAYPPAVARSFPKEITDLIGYRIHRPNLGGYENQCPTVLFDQEHSDSLPAIDSFPPEIEEQLKEYRKRAG